MNMELSPTPGWFWEKPLKKRSLPPAFSHKFRTAFPKLNFWESRYEFPKFSAEKPIK
jgi:hypothetical protein